MPWDRRGDFATKFAQLRADHPPSRLATKAGECVQIIANHSIAAAVGGLRPIDRVSTHSSHESPSIQLCDLLLGAVMDAMLQKATSPAKLELQRHIARHLGWPDLRAGTFAGARKFNTWFFYDPTRGPRQVMGRGLGVLHPLN